MYRLKCLKGKIASVVTIAMLFTGNTATLYADEAQFEAAGADAVEAVAVQQAEEAVVEETETEEAAEDASDEAIVAESDVTSEDYKYTIEINQGFSKHVGKDQKKADDVNYMSNFVSGRNTLITIPIEAENEEKAKEVTSKWELYYKKVTNGNEGDKESTQWKGDEFSFKEYYDEDSNTVSGQYMACVQFTGPEKGKYNFYLEDNGSVVAKNDNNDFYDTVPLNILAVPVTSYYSKSANVKPTGGGGCPADKVGQGVPCDPSLWNGITEKVKTYLNDVYPLAQINVDEGHVLEAGEAKYDMCTDDGQKQLWEEACKLQSKNKETGKDKYDMILAFVMYRQDAGGTGQGYTYGRPTNIITLTDLDMLPTVAHEIAHCYDVGDEYDGGSYNYRVNNLPLDFTSAGRDKITSDPVNNTTDYTFKNVPSYESKKDTYYWLSSGQYKNGLGGKTVMNGKSDIEENGNGSVVYPSLHPYSFRDGEFVHYAVEGDKAFPTISYMGSGYSGDKGYYFTTSVIYDHLFNKFLVKSKKEDKNSGSGESGSGESGSGESGSGESGSGESGSGESGSGESGSGESGSGESGSGEPGSGESGSSESGSGESGSSEASSGESGSSEASSDGEDGAEEDNDDLELYYDEEYREGESRMVEVEGSIEYESKDVSANYTHAEVEPMFSYQGDLSYIEYLDLDGEDKGIHEDDIFVFAAIGEDGKVMKSPVDGEESVVEFYGGNFNSGMPAPKSPDLPDKRFQDFCEFSFDAEYPEGTKMFIIVNINDYDAEKVYKKDSDGVLWFKEAPDKEIDGDILDVEAGKTEFSLEWNAAAYDEDDKATTKNLYTMLYFAPQGDEGDVYFIDDGDYENDFGAAKDGYASFSFNPSEYTDNITDKAYVWIKVSDGVNGLDLYSDEFKPGQKEPSENDVPGENNPSENKTPTQKAEEIVKSELAGDVKTQVAGDTVRIKKEGKNYSIDGLDQLTGNQTLTVNAGAKFTSAELGKADLSKAQITIGGKPGDAKDIKKHIKLNSKGILTVKADKTVASYTVTIPLEKSTLILNVVNVGFDKELKKKNITALSGSGSSVSVNLSELAGKSISGASKFLSAEWTIDGKTPVTVGTPGKSKKGLDVTLSKDNTTITVSNPGSVSKGAVKITAIINGRKYTTSIKVKVPKAPKAPKADAGSSAK